MTRGSATAPGSTYIRDLALLSQTRKGGSMPKKGEDAEWTKAWKRSKRGLH